MTTPGTERASMSHIILLPQHACGVLQLHQDLCASFGLRQGGKGTISRLSHSFDERLLRDLEDDLLRQLISPAAQGQTSLLYHYSCFLPSPCAHPGSWSMGIPFSQ